MTASGFKQDSLGPWIEKDPSANLDYTFNWGPDDLGNPGWLGVDTISTVVWTVPTGVTKTSQGNSNTLATAWFSGGTAGTTYLISATITTAAGRTDKRSFRLVVKSR